MSETPPRSRAFQAVLDYLDSKDFNYSSFPEEGRVTFSMSGKNANCRLLARITHGEKYLQITSYYPFFVREEKLRGSTAELITRANYAMPVGKFEMDMKDGEVRFHITHVIDGGEISAEHIERLFLTSYYTADRYFPAFMQHIHAGYTPEDAVFLAELDIHSERIDEEPTTAKKRRSKPKTSNAPEAPPSGSDQPASASKKTQRKKSGEGRKNQNEDQGELPL